jgi:hypothetical protein
VDADDELDANDTPHLDKGKHKQKDTEDTDVDGDDGVGADVDFDEEDKEELPIFPSLVMCSSKASGLQTAQRSKY